MVEGGERQKKNERFNRNVIIVHRCKGNPNYASVFRNLTCKVLEICALFGILRTVEWQSFTDVSAQPIGSVFKGQEVKGTDKLSRNVGKGLPPDAA